MTPLALADKMAFLTTGVWDIAWLDTGFGVVSGWYSLRTDLYNPPNEAWAIRSNVTEMVTNDACFHGRHEP